MHSNALFLGLLTLAPSALAWGTLGHESIAYVAQDFVTAKTKSWAQKILGDTSDDYLAKVATWADSFKYTSAGGFSESFHYIDAADSPPQTCNVDYNRDCADENCVVSAIVNYTSLIQASSSSASLKNDSLMFLVHFLGDIHQPLHDEKLEVGGNDIDVMFGSSSTNLHHVWDTNAPEKYGGSASLENARKLGTQITNQIKSGNFSTQAKGWLTDMSTEEAQASAMAWATDANKYVCSVVLPGGVSSVENKDLSGAYYAGMMPTVELQFAKAGYRLAAWLNLLATGSTGISSKYGESR